MIFYRFFRKFSLESALDAIEDLCDTVDNGHPINVHALYITPPDNDDELSGEDDTEADFGGIPDNVCAGQLRASCEIVFEDGRRITDMDDFDDSTGIHDEELLAHILNAPIVFDDQTIHEASTSTATPPPQKRLRRVQSVSSDVTIPAANKNTTFAWEKDTTSACLPIFPDANYEDCKGLKAHEQFEKFFDDDLLQHICDCSSIYASYRNRKVANITIPGNEWQNI